MIQAWLLQDVVVEKEVFEAKTKARDEILKQFGQSNVVGAVPDGDVPDNVVRIDKSGVTHVGYFPTIIYDEKGRPRPAPVAYDSDYSDDSSLAPRAEGDLRRNGTVDTEDEADVIRFPGLDPPLG